MPYRSDNIFAESICLYGGLTGSDLLGCINDDDKGLFETYELLAFEAQMLPTRQILIEFNNANYGLLRELEIEYQGELIS